MPDLDKQSDGDEQQREHKGGRPDDLAADEAQGSGAGGTIKGSQFVGNPGNSGAGGSVGRGGKGGGSQGGKGQGDLNGG